MNTSENSGPIDRHEILRRVSACQQKRAALMGRKTSLKDQRTRLVQEISKAQERIDAADFVQEILEKLQKREHERAVGAYEELLSAFLSDVLPGEREVVMDLTTERGAPALDIKIRKGQGAPLEDALYGTGGSVTNLLSTGLRLIALLRSGQKRFLVLDESDCWIKPDLIPQYANIVAQMANDLGVQILMISHHDESLFADHIPHRLKMTKQGTQVLVEWSPSSDIPVWEEDAHGLRSMSLRDFQSHQNTIIPLSPNVTLLQGDNDIGKSAVVNALRCVFDGEGGEHVIKHGAASSQVALDFGPEHTLIWKRYRKGKVLCSYILQNNHNQEIIHQTDGTKTPEWLIDQLKIGRIDGMDVQIGQQQDPIFLLNKPASQRAKALAIGQESGHIQTMFNLEKQELQECKTIVKNGERSLERSRHELLALDQIGESGPDFNQVHDVFEQMEKNNKRQKLFAQWMQAQARVQTLAITERTPLTLPGVPKETSLPLLTLWSKWREAQAKHIHLNELKKNAPTFPSLKAMPLLMVWEKWRTMTDVFAALNGVSKAASVKDLPAPKASALIKLAGVWGKNQQTIKLLAPLAQKSPPELPQSKPHPGRSLIEVWQKHRDKVELLSHIQGRGALAMPEQTHTQWQNIHESWLRSHQAWCNIDHDIEQLTSSEKDLLVELTNAAPVCPVCQKNWD